jgi:hypothetical protein
LDVGGFRVNVKRILYARDAYLFLLRESQKETGVVLER